MGYAGAVSPRAPHLHPPSLSALRASAWAALGLGATSCGASGGVDTRATDLPPPPPQTAFATASAARPVPAEDHAARCGPDELRDVACTEQRASSCAPSVPFGTSFYISDIDAWGSQAGFQLDPGLSQDMTAIEPERPKCCYLRCTPFKVAAGAPAPVAAPTSDRQVRPRCQPMPDAPSRFPAPGAERCAAAVVLQQGRELRPFREARPASEDAARRARGWIRGQCCYDDLVDVRGVGRAFRVAGRRTLPGPALRSPRDAVAAHWHAVARGEHASIASFAALERALARHGAPAELVRATRRARRDEARHARFAYAWLRRLSGQRVTRRPLRARAEEVDLATLAIDTLRDGCFEETLGALLLARMAETARDAELAAALSAVAVDEARHAALAWRVLAFALAQDPGLAPRLRAELARLPDAIARLGGAPDDALEGEGVPARATVAALAEAALREVVTPCLEAALTTGRRATCAETRPA